MRQAIRAFSWAANIFWIIMLFFAGTAVYSAVLLVNERAIGFGDPSISTQGGTVTFSFPFYINNVGLYDISNLSFTTLVNDKNDSLISDSSTPPQLVPRGSNVTVSYNITMSLSQMTTENLSYLLFDDSAFDVYITLRLNYANAVPFEISTNFTLPWGAPLSNLTLGPYSPTPSGVILPISFENHSFFELNGTMRLEIVDNVNQVVGEGTTNIKVQPQSGYGTGIDVSISGDPASIGKARLYFQTSVLSYGPVVIPFVRE